MSALWKEQKWCQWRLWSKYQTPQRNSRYCYSFFFIWSISKIFCNQIILKVTSKAQGATNPIRNVQMYGNRFVVYAKFVEAVQRFVRQYNVPLLSYVFFDPAFFVGWKLFCAFVYLYLLTWMPRQCLVFPLTLYNLDRISFR